MCNLDNHCEWHAIRNTVPTEDGRYTYSLFSFEEPMWKPIEAVLVKTNEYEQLVADARKWREHNARNSTQPRS